jgi:hypothetical protein
MIRSSRLAFQRTSAHVQAHRGIGMWMGLITAALLTRLPLQSRLLYHFDSVNFAMALRGFDVANGQPHAPGYPLYILLGHGAAWLMGSAQGGYTMIAAVSSALAAIALADLGRRMWNTQVGWLSALLLLSSPLFWFYGEVALPHTLDALLVIVAAIMCWRIWHGDQRLAPWLALWLGIAGGIRQQTLVFLLPLVVLTCARLPFRLIIGSLAVLAVTVLAWLLPLLILSGGVERYFTIVAAYSEAFDRPTSVFLGAGWAGLIYNLDKLTRYTLWGWAFGSLPALGALLWRPVPRMLVRDRRVWFLAVWATPCLLFYTLIHMGQQGLIFVYLPILMLLGACGAALLASRIRWGMAVVLACVALNVMLYLFAPVYLLPGQLKVLSQATIAEHDTLLLAQIDATHSDLPPDALLLVDSWRFAQYYLPGVEVIPYNNTANDDVELAPTLKPEILAQIADAPALAWYEPIVDHYNLAPDRTILMSDHQGVQLRVLRRAVDERFRITPKGFGIEKQGQ